MPNDLYLSMFWINSLFRFSVLMLLQMSRNLVLRHGLMPALCIRQRCDDGFSWSVDLSYQLMCTRHVSLFEKFHRNWEPRNNMIFAHFDNALLSVLGTTLVIARARHCNLGW